MTLREWVLLLVLGFFCMGTIKADDEIMQCVHRGKLASAMVFAVSEGYELDKVNVRFRILPRNAAEQAESDRYVEEVRKEVRALLDGQFVPARDQDFADRIGIKVSEACAFRYGKEHGFMKETGSAPPLTEEQATNLMMPAASSTSIEGPPIGREAYCKDLHYDLDVIGRAISDGIPADQLRALANKSIAYLGDERLARILSMIDEAYAWEKPYIDFIDKEYAECTGG
jgi:hypothetical protein